MIRKVRIYFIFLCVSKWWFGFNCFVSPIAIIVLLNLALFRKLSYSPIGAQICSNQKSSPPKQIITAGMFPLKITLKLISCECVPFKCVPQLIRRTDKHQPLPFPGNSPPVVPGFFPKPLGITSKVAYSFFQIALTFCSYIIHYLQLFGWLNKQKQTIFVEFADPPPSRVIMKLYQFFLDSECKLQRHQFSECELNSCVCIVYN